MRAAVWVPALTALAAGTFGGMMASFSAFVMPALDDLAAADAITAMQAINEHAPRSPLMLPLGGAALGGVAVTAAALLGDPPDRALRLLGAGLVLGGVVITVAANVPLNETLARVSTSEAGGGLGAAWTAYAQPWTTWNHLRTASSLAGAAALAVVAARA